MPLNNKNKQTNTLTYKSATSSQHFITVFTDKITTKKILMTFQPVKTNA